mgnify:CR=1 FL=1
MTKLYTDTSANLPLALLREYDIAVIPFSYTVNGVAEDYSEETDFDGKAFYDAMRRGAEVKTSMVNPATAAANARSRRATMCSTSVCPAASAARRTPRRSRRRSCGKNILTPKS